MDSLRRLFGIRPSEEPTPKVEEGDTKPLPRPSEEDIAERPTEPGISVVSHVTKNEYEDEEVSDTVPNAALAQDEIDSTKPLPEVDAQLEAKKGQVMMDGRTRQLPPLENVAPKMGSRVVFGQLSHPGQVRDNNQDSSFAMVATLSSDEYNPHFGLFIVADGMGGHELGEKASALTAHIVSKQVFNKIIMPIAASNLGNDSDRPTIADELRAAVQKANDVISEEVPDGGTTLTAAAIMNNQAYIAHVGDSRAYIINYGEIEQITRDHSLVQRLIELDQLSPEEAHDYPQRNVLYRAVGQSDNLDVDTIFRQVPAGSYLLLCSDGLWNLVSDQEMLEIVMGSGSNTQDACQKLVNLANERGGNDNITVIIVRIPN